MKKYINAASKNGTTAELKQLYSIEIGSDGYGGTRVIAVFEDRSGKRYMWSTRSSSLYSDLKNDYVKVIFNVRQVFPCGDTQIERLRMDNRKM